MPVSVSLTEANVFQVLGDFLTAILPSDVEIIRGQVNRVAEPSVPNYCVMWSLLQERLATNLSTQEDVAYVGSISGTTLTISEMLAGAVAVGQTLTGQGVATNTTIVSGNGFSWQVSISQTVSSTVIQSGIQGIEQAIRWPIQIDVHGPDGGANAGIISTLLRDEYGVDFFAASEFDVAPLYTETPRQVPFLNAEQQYEERWVVDASLQVNQVVTVSQQYADALQVDVISVEAEYPR